MIFQTFSFQQSIYEWARDHRVHHKFTDTEADPHNSKKGLFSNSLCKYVFMKNRIYIYLFSYFYIKQACKMIYP